ncbi:hypothetical protein evm_009478 [Chilo suppressalis]|nr:hypothetical protein evm_009478 [Chilo suppressalis]
MRTCGPNEETKLRWLRSSHIDSSVINFIGEKVLTRKFSNRLCSGLPAHVLGVVISAERRPENVPTLQPPQHQPINVPDAAAQAFPMDGTGRLGHGLPRGPSADWRVLTNAGATGTNGRAFRSKEKLEIINFWPPIQ